MKTIPPAQLYNYRSLIQIMDLCLAHDKTNLSDDAYEHLYCTHQLLRSDLSQHDETETEKLYIVKLKIVCGEVEKYTVHVVTADDEQDARNKALLGEVHNSIGDGAYIDEDSTEMDDFNGEYLYRVYSVDQIDLYTYLILKKHL